MSAAAFTRGPPGYDAMFSTERRRGERQWDESCDALSISAYDSSRSSSW